MLAHRRSERHPVPEGLSRVCQTATGTLLHIPTNRRIESCRAHNGVFACCGVLSSRVRAVGGGSGLFQGCSSVVGRCLCWVCRFKARRRWRSIEIPGASSRRRCPNLGRGQVVAAPWSRVVAKT